MRIAFAEGLGEAILRTRVSAKDIFGTTVVRVSVNVDDDVSKAGFGHTQDQYSRDRLGGFGCPFPAQSVTRADEAWSQSEGKDVFLYIGGAARHSSFLFRSNCRFVHSGVAASI
jgi:hypothetical protein